MIIVTLVIRADIYIHIRQRRRVLKNAQNTPMIQSSVQHAWKTLLLSLSARAAVCFFGAIS